jgi:hypothetical protein
MLSTIIKSFGDPPDLCYSSTYQLRVFEYLKIMTATNIQANTASVKGTGAWSILGMA